MATVFDTRQAVADFIVGIFSGLADAFIGLLTCIRDRIAGEISKVNDTIRSLSLGDPFFLVKITVAFLEFPIRASIEVIQCTIDFVAGLPNIVSFSAINAIVSNIKWDSRLKTSVIKVSDFLEAMLQSVGQSGSVSVFSLLPEIMQRQLVLRAFEKAFTSLRRLFRGRIFGPIASYVETVAKRLVQGILSAALTVAVPFILLYILDLIINESPILFSKVLGQKTPRKKWYAHRGLDEVAAGSKHRIVRRRDAGGNPP